MVCAGTMITGSAASGMRYLRATLLRSSTVSDSNSGTLLVTRVSFCGCSWEPLTMAAKRHARDPRAVLDAFRSLEHGGPTDEQVTRAIARVQR